MKKIVLFISFLLLTAVAATAQTMNVRVGQVTYAHRAANTGDMTITGGNTLTIEGKAYNTSSISQISIDDSNVADNTVSVSYAGQTATVVVSGNIAHLVTVSVSGANVSITQSEALQQEVTYTLSGTSSNGSFFMDGDYKANFVLNNLSLTNPAGCPLDIQDGKAISVTLQGNNQLTDCANGTHNATLYINGHPTFSGTGSLTLTGLTKHAFTSEEISTAKPWAISGSKKGTRSVVKSLRLQPEVLEEHVEHLFEKYAVMEKELERVECEGLEDAEVVFVAFGTMARLAREAMELLEARGIKAGLIRPITLFPFCTKSFEKLDYGKLKGILVAELSIPAQMIEDVELATKGRVPLESLTHSGGRFIITEEVYDRLKAMALGNTKEVK